MVDVGLTVQTERGPLTATSRYKPLTQETIDLPRASTARSMLRVSPHIAPRPFIEPTPALKSLLAGAQLSHYNYLVGSYHTPRKQDYFHEKTIICNFNPSFRSSHFAHCRYELPPQPFPLPSRPSQFRLHHKTASTVPRLIPKHKVLSPVPAPRNESQQPGRLLKRTYTTSHMRLGDFSRVSKLKPRPILCVEDGQNLNKSQVKAHMIEFLDYIQKYIGFAPSSYLESDIEDAAVSLKNQGLMELLENVTQALKPEKPYEAVFMLDGLKVEDLAKVPFNCRALLFSFTGKFQGVTGSSE